MPHPTSRTLYDELIALRDQQREEKRAGMLVVRGKERPQETNPQGRMSWYLHPALHDTVIRTLMFFRQEIPPGSRSGQQKHQGGSVMYILNGKGHTIIDGVSYHWYKGCLLNFPLRRDGVIFQHFNDDADHVAEFVWCEPNAVDALGVDRGCGFEQLELAPEYDATQTTVEKAKS